MNCPKCSQEFSCCAGASDCWCFNISGPYQLPVPTLSGNACICPSCLKEFLIENLREVISKAAQAYYESPDDVFLSDEQYDAYVEQLRNLDPKDSTLGKVGAEVRSSIWQKVVHPFPLGSLNKAKNFSELERWWTVRQETLKT